MVKQEAVFAVYSPPNPTLPHLLVVWGPDGKIAMTEPFPSYNAAYACARKLVSEAYKTFGSTFGDATSRSDH